MDSIAYFLDEIEKTNLRRELKRLRYNTMDIFDMDDKMFVKNFRINKDAFQYILNELEDEVGTKRLGILKTVDKLAACLRFFAEGNYQHGVGKDWHLNISQSTFSKLLAEMLILLEQKICPKCIRTEMDDQTKESANLYFFQKSSIPRVIMAIDGTHVKIVTPSSGRHFFYNRKGYHSINVMLGCDHLNRIRFINSSYPGSCHDSHIWKLSNVRKHFVEQYHLGKRDLILGDAGYALEPWLLTPYRSPSVGSLEAKFNLAHAKGRNVIERNIGIVKNTFRCLITGLYYSPEKAARIINVCCALHNIRIHFCRPNEHLDDLDEYVDYEILLEHLDAEEASSEAILMRNSILNSLQEIN